MDLYNSPKEMQDKILKLAEEHPITIEDAKHYYRMGGEFADELCRMKTAGFPEEFIKLQNDAYWIKKNNQIIKELENDVRNSFNASKYLDKR